MTFLRNVCLVTVVTVGFFLGVDFFLTSLALDPMNKRTQKNAFITRERHNVYHHDLKKNVDVETSFGSSFYRLCTNEFGFKISCADKGKESEKKYDIAFIGDSFTEAEGMDYEKSFVGLFAQNNPSLKVVNLGVASYSPSIYFVKIAHLLKQGFTFKHVVVAIDISDISNEGLLYDISNDGRKIVEKTKITSSGEVAQKNTTKPKANTAKPKTKSVIEKYFGYTWHLNLIIHEFFYPTKLSLKRFDNYPYISDWTHVTKSEHYGKNGVDAAIQQSLESMEKLKNLLDAHGILMSVFVYPWPAQLMYAPMNHRGVTVWENFCKEKKCANFINANPLFYAEMERTSLEEVIHANYFLGDFHFNTQGNKLMYEALQKGFLHK